jgi:hypothetical protein
MNADGTFKNMSGVTAGGQWINAGLEPTYVDNNTFTVAGDQTDIFVALRRVKVGLSASTVYAEVSSSAYSAGTGLTTVNITGTALTDPLTTIEHSTFTPVSANNSAISENMVLGNTSTELNTASTVVRRDASGDFAAGIITADLVGNVTGNASGTAGNVTFRGVMLTGSQSIPYTDTGTLLTFTTELYDTSSLHESVTNPGRITIPAGVSYVRVGGYMYAGVATTTHPMLRITHTGSSGLPAVIAMGGSTDAYLSWLATTTVYANCFSPILPVSEGDIFTLYADTLAATETWTTGFWLEVIQ